MFDKKEIVIENKKPFSQSIMWGAQKAYYDEKGIEAWTDDVPNYITSNPFIGRSYAQLILAFIQDLIAKDPSSIKHPFYILELGTGTGQFSFYCLKYLLSYLKTLQLKDVKICYVMSDVTTKQFEFWQKHPALQAYLDAGVLDFATFDLYRSHDIVLANSHQTIDANALHNPLIVIANYLFDSIANDVFTVNNGELFESLATITAPEESLQDGVPTDWEKASIAYHEEKVQAPYYGGEFDHILFDYADKLIDSHFQFPIAALKALKNLQALSNSRFLLLTSDKGYTTLDELDYLEYPDLDFHGCFSVMVNYHALGQYLKQSGGDQKIQAFRDNIVSGVLSSGFDFKSLPQLQLAMGQVLDSFSPTDYFLAYEHIAENYKKCTYAQLATFLNLSNWDPHLYDQISGHLAEIAEDGDPEVTAYLVEKLPLVADNIYFSPSMNDVLFDIGVFYQNVAQFEQAIVFYNRSNQLFGDSDITWFNIGICYHSLHHKEAALSALKRALQLNAEAHDAKAWIETIESE